MQVAARPPQHSGSGACPGYSLRPNHWGPGNTLGINHQMDPPRTEGLQEDFFFCQCTSQDISVRRPQWALEAEEMTHKYAIGSICSWNINIQAELFMLAELSRLCLGHKGSLTGFSDQFVTFPFSFFAYTKCTVTVIIRRKCSIINKFHTENNGRQFHSHFNDNDKNVYQKLTHHSDEEAPMKSS